MSLSLEQKFLKLTKFLLQYEDIYKVEFLKKYPKPMPDFMISWLEELKNWDFDRLAAMESHPHEDLVEDENLKQFLKNIRELSILPQEVITESELPKEFLRKMNTKKRHEVQTLKTLVNNLDSIETIIDIGGGAGHLTCALLSGKKTQSLCIDLDKILQESGRKKIKRWHPEINDQIKFITKKFDESSTIDEVFNPLKTTVIGLHSCGPLSTDLIKFAVKNNVRGVINFGCCYHKLTDEYNISKIAQENALHLSNNALHLAGRSAAVINAEDLNKRFKVKSYRYALHYFLYDHFKLPFYSVGNSKVSDYEGDFCAYAKKYHQGTELDSIDDQALMDYYNDSSVQEKIMNNFLADIIRMHFGRLIEIYLLLDRALYLEESGRKVQLVECFDRSLSPRNIMIKC